MITNLLNLKLATTFLTLFISHSLLAYDFSIKTIEPLHKSEKSEMHKIKVEDKMFGAHFSIFKRKSLIATSDYQPTLFVLSGLHTEQATLENFPEIDGVTVISLDYEIPIKNHEVRNLQDALAQMNLIQTRIIAAYNWLYTQTDIDKNKISSVNISFGSFIAPSALRALALMGKTPASTIFVFGGSRLDAFLNPLLNGTGDRPPIEIPEFIRRGLNQFLITISPSQHLKALKGPFLAINGLFDEMIPRESAEALHQELPQPKDILWLPTQHINLERPQIVLATLNPIIAWLKEQKVI